MTHNPTDWRQLSHELRTPLNAIAGNLELLLDGSAGPLSIEARACLGEIQAASRELVRQVQVLLTWSELRESGPGRATTTVDLIALVRLSRATGGDAPTIVPPDANFAVRGDPAWLRTLVTEIMDLDRVSRQARGPVIRFERYCDGICLDFSWPDFRAAEVRSTQIALIAAIARLQGAAAGLTEAGLRLDWPTADTGAG
jgi:signal transduction histidine kinase